MLDVWGKGNIRDSSPCDEVFEQIPQERRDYFYGVWGEKYPSLTAAIVAEMAALRRQLYRQHKTL